MSKSTFKAKTEKSRDKRPTIAFFSELYLTPGSYFWLQWAGVMDKAKELDINLISVIGGILGVKEDGHCEPNRNRLYELITSENVDGIIIAGGILTYITPGEIRAFFKRYSPLPVVPIAQTLPDVPGILVENKKGMRELFTHLIEEHGYRRIAFIKGPGDFGDAMVRFEIYKEMLAEYGLPFDPELVVPGDYIHTSGGQALRILLDERQVRFDVLVAANDNMALGAMWELQMRGFRIPQDVAVAGYDNTDEAKMAKPSLTTVYQPVYEQGRHAVDMLLAMINGEQTPQKVVLPTKIVIGQSCGCLLSTVLHAGDETPEFAFQNRTEPECFGPEAFTSLRPGAVQAMVTAITPFAETARLAPEQARTWMCRLFDEFSSDLQAAHECKTEEPFPGEKDIRKSASFLLVLSDMLDHRGYGGGDTMLWHDVISALRRNMLPLLTRTTCIKFAERLWGQARVLISDSIERLEVSRRYDASSQTTRVFKMNEALNTTFDSKRLVDLLAERIGSLGIFSCYLARYTGGDYEKGNLKLMLALTSLERKEIPGEQEVYRANQILPPDFWPGEGFHLMLESLHFLDDPLGIVLFEAGPAYGDIYENLRSQISNGLKGSDRARALERANQEIRKLNLELKDENLHMRMEMDLARRIQTALLPAGIKSIHRDFDISAVMRPAEQVGGDYYDITLDRSGVLWLGIGDVSGHGLTPGLIMMMAQTVHTAITTNFNASARDIVIMINKALYKNVQVRLHEDHFMTFTTLKYLGQGRFQFAGAHADLVVYRKQTGCCELIETAGLFLNFIPNIEDVTCNLECTLEIGDILVLYTDGLTEARNDKKEFFDLSGLSGSVIKHADKSVDGLRDGIMNDVLSWTGGRQDDDMSLVVIRRVM